MRIRESNDIDPVVLSLKGNPLGEPDAILLRKKVNDLVGEGVRRLVLDLREVMHINSSGIGGLVAAMTSLRKVGGDVRLAGINRYVQEILSMTHLNEVLESYKTVDLAKASFLR